MYHSVTHFVFLHSGNSVIGKRGELVVCTPAPNFPTGLFKDENNTRLKEIYLSKYPGAYTALPRKISF